MIRRMRRHLCASVAALAILTSATAAHADPHEVRLPLHNGKLSAAKLSDELLNKLHLSVPAGYLPAGELDLSGVGGWLVVAGLNHALGDGCKLELKSDALVLHVDPDKLPHDVDGAKAAVRAFVKQAAPEAAAAQARRCGLLLPKVVDPAKPLVVLVHGLDTGPGDWSAMADLLGKAGYQTARFDFPADGPVADDVALFAKHMTAVRQTYPTLRVDVVAFSMGSLVARGYLEGPDYAGGVGRFVMIAPPNHGSSWTTFECVAKARHHLDQAMNDKEFHWAWVVTDGLGEAGRDLTPGSKFLTDLNARGRRAGVRYTIVEGNMSPFRRIGADWLAAPAGWVPHRVEGWWGVRQAKAGLTSASASLRDHADAGDGPVPLESAKLDGVGDFVVLHADHSTLCQPDGTNPPVAWATVRDRLGRP